MAIIFMIIGILFVVTVLLVISAFAISTITESIKRRKDSNLRSRWISYMGQVNRYCDYEFRQIGLMAREIIKALHDDTEFDADIFREFLRTKEKEIRNEIIEPLTLDKFKKDVSKIRVTIDQSWKEFGNLYGVRIFEDTTLFPDTWYIAVSSNIYKKIKESPNAT